MLQEFKLPLRESFGSNVETDLVEVAKQHVVLLVNSVWLIGGDLFLGREKESTRNSSAG